MKNLFRTMIMSGYSRQVSSTSAVAAKNPTRTKLTGVSKQYALAAKSIPVQWNVTFAKRSDNATGDSVQLTGDAGPENPSCAHPCQHRCRGGGILLDFAPVDGATGKSETVTRR